MHVLYCIALHCIVLYCIVLYCIVLYCTVLYCTGQFRQFNFVVYHMLTTSLQLLFRVNQTYNLSCTTRKMSQDNETYFKILGQSKVQEVLNDKNRV